MNTKSLWIIFLFLLWGSGSTYWYVCKIKGFCENHKQVMQKPSEKTPDKTITKKVVKHDLLYYLWGKSKVNVADTAQWQAEVKSIKQLQAEGKKLRIEAPYYQNEPNNTGFDNLGLARAEGIKNMLSKDIDTSLMITSGKLLKGMPDPHPYFVDGYKNYLNWITYNDFVQEKGDGKTLIHFPYNSTKEIKNKAIISYLNELSQKVKNEPSFKVLVVGHTDNSGSPESNQTLGLKRAQRTKNVLIKNGIDAGRIIVKSAGESQPIADNQTAAGRQENRRVEISLIKNQ